MTEFAPPTEYLQYAEQMDRVAETLRFYLDQSPAWRPGSSASDEMAAESSVSPLGFDRPVLATLTRATQCLGAAHDHLVAAAAIVRTPRTVFALYTVTRTLLISAAQAFYLTKTGVDVRERVRRGMNLQLATWAEVANLAGMDSPDGVRAIAQRQKVIADGRKLQFHVHSPGAKGNFIEPRKWHLGYQLPGDGKLIDELLVAGPEDHFGETVFKMLSAFAHGQAHSTMMLVHDWQSSPISDDGVRNVRVSMNEQQLLLLLIAIGAVLETAVARTGSLFGWDMMRWNSAATPVLIEWGRRHRDLTGDI